MASDDQSRKVLKRLLWITVGILFGVVGGTLLGWQFAPAFVLIFFGVGWATNWAANQGQKQKRETDAYREQWLNKRRTHNEGRNRHRIDSWKCGDTRCWTASFRPGRGCIPLNRSLLVALVSRPRRANFQPRSGFGFGLTRESWR